MSNRRHQKAVAWKRKHRPQHEIDRLRAARNDVNSLMFGWKQTDAGKFEEGKVTIRVLSRIIKDLEEKMNNESTE